MNYVGIGSPQIINLSGNGATVVQFHPVAEQFGQQRVNISSARLTVGIDNYGSTSVNLATPTVQGADFSLAGNHCGSTLARNTGCSVDIVFTPSAKGLRTGTVTIMASDYSHSITAALQGIGISAGAGVLSVPSIVFSAQKVGTESAAKQITLTNTGTGPLGVTSVSASPQFSVATTNCNTPIAAGSKCLISVTFDPAVVGILAGTLTVQDDGANGRHSVILSGTGK